MPTLADIMSFIDARKRSVANTARDIADDPVGGAKLAGTRMIDMLKSGAQNQLDAAGNMQSVMPGGMESGIDQLLAGPLGMAQLGLTAWHGTPHSFTKFDSSKLGTGQGAQMYTKGHYLAEEPTVAKEYRRELAKVEVRLGDTNIDDIIAKGGRAGQAAQRLKSDFTNTSVAQHVDDVTSPDFWRATEDFHNKANPDIAKLIAKHGPVSASNQGYLYKVDLPDEHIANMLDWDKHLKYQPQYVQDAIMRLASDPKSIFAMNMKHYGLTPEDLMHSSGQWIVDMAGGEEFAANGLRSVGIPGLKYLDAESRRSHVYSADKGIHKNPKKTQNFVVYDDDIPKIIGRE